MSPLFYISLGVASALLGVNIMVILAALRMQAEREVAAARPTRAQLPWGDDFPDLRAPEDRDLWERETV
jgi:hypothetical protein